MFTATDVLWEGARVASDVLGCDGGVSLTFQGNQNGECYSFSGAPGLAVSESGNLVNRLDDS